jgi:predicted RNase H-like nuclease (RuvC/YqgF family)
MATTKKTMAKESALKAQPEEFRMPVEVKEWIDQASSRINSMRTEIDRLKEENKSLKRSHKLMEQRVMGTSSE